jgi:hypothetical protein
MRSKNLTLKNKNPAMKVTQISYSESHEYMSEMGLRMWKKVSMDAVIEDSDQIDGSLDALKQLVKDGFSAGGGSAVRQETATTQRQTTAEKIISDIATVTDIKILEACYAALAKKNADIMAAYEQKQKQLTK